MPVQPALQSWTLNSAPAAGAQPTASRAAGTGTQKHCIRSINFGFSATTALAAISTVTINVRDGASGAGTVLWSLQFTLPAAVISPFAFSISDVVLKGSAATAMTVEFAAAIGNLMGFVNAEGYDTD